MKNTKYAILINDDLLHTLFDELSVAKYFLFLDSSEKSGGKNKGGK